MLHDKRVLESTCTNTTICILNNERISHTNKNGVVN